MFTCWMQEMRHSWIRSFCDTSTDRILECYSWANNEFLLLPRASSLVTIGKEEDSSSGVGKVGALCLKQLLSWKPVHHYQFIIQNFLDDFIFGVSFRKNFKQFWTHVENGKDIAIPFIYCVSHHISSCNGRRWTFLNGTTRSKSGNMEEPTWLDLSRSTFLAQLCLHPMTQSDKSSSVLWSWDNRRLSRIASP